MKIKLTYLIATVVLMIISVAAMAQGGASPFAGSTHGYKVTPGDGGNTLVWSVSPGTGYTVNSGAATDSLNITWNTAGTYTLTFTETDVATLCSTEKQITIEVTDNTFDVTISDSIITCNSADGKVNFVGPDTTTQVSFTVDTVGVDWDYDWEFKFTLASGATITNLLASDGDAITGSGTAGDPYVVTNISGTVPSVDITMDVTGSAFTQQSVVMEIVEATELKYNTPALLNANTLSTSLINAIPNTSDITTD